MQRGVYFLADDGVFDLVVTFLNSFRKYNPDIPLCLIPYNENTGRLRELQAAYRFFLYSRAEVLARCDEISARFHPRVVGHYRKLACWEGDFDEFIYIDVDTVVLRDIDFVFPFLSSYEFITSHSNLPWLLEWVWKPSILGTGRLSIEQIGFAANTGFIASKKGALTVKGIGGRVESAAALSEHMALSCMEQPLLNYLIVTSGKRYTSLLVLANTKVPKGISFEHWAGIRGPEVVEGQLTIGGERAPILLVHWAGEWQPRFADKIIFFFQRSLRLRRDTKGVRFFMPYKKLWRYYRFLHEREVLKAHTNP